MPLHDWSRLHDGFYHSFHTRWMSALHDALNEQLLPPTHYALIEQRIAGYVPDLLTLQLRDHSMTNGFDHSTGSGAIVLQTRPRTTMLIEADRNVEQETTKTLTVRHISDDKVVAVIEVVSPGNKSSQEAIDALVTKCCSLLQQRIHLMVLDPFSPGPRDPAGVHGLIWSHVSDKPTALPPDKPILFSSYEATYKPRAYLEPIALGESLPTLPLFLKEDGCVMVNLETTYQQAYHYFPKSLRSVLENDGSA